MYTISDLKTDATNHLHGTTLNKVPDVNGLIFEAGRNVLTRIDPRETKRISSLTNAIYDDVYDYALPADLKGKKVVDIRPIEGQTISDEMYQWYNSEFQQYKTSLDGAFAIKDNSGVKTIQIAKELTQGETVHTMDSYDGNGTWTGTNNATTVETDTFSKMSGSGSVKFTITASGSTATLTNNSMTAVDLSDEEDVGSLFMWVYFSAVTPITSVQLKWGSDSSNYWHKTVTTNQDGSNFIVGWNLLRFDWDGANEVSSPDSTVVDYLQINIAYDGTAITTVRLDNIVARLSSTFEIEYYSKYLFKNSSGTWIEKPTEDTDIVNLDTEAYNLILYEFLHLVSQVVQGEEGKFDLGYFTDKRKEAWDVYMADNKSEINKPSSSYYRPLYTKRRQ
jgi:hypothetical protein